MFFKYEKQNKIEKKMIKNKKKWKWKNEMSWNKVK